jgi:sulfur carrier protein
VIRTQINGEVREFREGLSLAQIMEQLGVRQATGIAVAVNDAVIPRDHHENFRPKDGDAIEIIRAVAGG